MLSWLEGAFQTVLNMSIAAAVIIAAVLLARLLLRRAPKSFSYALWAVVLFRLLCPVSVSSAVSLLGLLDAPAQENTQYTTVIEYYAPPAVPQLSAPPVSVSAPPAVSEPVTGGGTAGGQAGAAGVGTGETAAIVWALGVCAMLIYGTASYIRLRRSLVGNIALEGNIHLADGINSPFVLGIFRPKIYLPSDICEGERDYIVLHERQHIRRGDHVFKALAFIALSLHWFNPLAWLAFVLAGRDMEMSCDEAVLKKLGEGVRADYSASLLRFAAGRRGALSVPLAFGESGIKGRIKNLLRWKRPRAWMSAAAALLCAIVLAACAVNPAADDGPARGEYGTAEDIGYCLELAASADGVEFGDMDAEILQQILDAKPDRIRIEGEVVLARMSADGRSAYVFLLDEGMEDDFTGYEDASLSAGVTLLEPGGSLERDPDSTTTLARVKPPLYLIEPLPGRKHPVHRVHLYLPARRLHADDVPGVNAHERAAPPLAQQQAVGVSPVLAQYQRGVLIYLHAQAAQLLAQLIIPLAAYVKPYLHALTSRMRQVYQRRCRASSAQAQLALHGARVAPPRLLSLFIRIPGPCNLRILRDTRMSTRNLTRM